MSEQSAGACSHDWQSYWDGSLGYSATDRCTMCGDYRPTPEPTEADSARAQATRDDCICRIGFIETVNPACPLHAGPLVVAIWEKSETYAPDATQCSKGHRFASEADCVLPEDWDYFMCRRCLNEDTNA